MKAYSVDMEQWFAFSADTQLKNIAVEFRRATRAGLGTTREQKEQEIGAYERAISLIDATIADPKWDKTRGNLYRLRDVASSLYSRGGDPAVSRFLETVLLRGEF